MAVFVLNHCFGIDNCLMKGKNEVSTKREAVSRACRRGMRAKSNLVYTPNLGKNFGVAPTKGGEGETWLWKECCLYSFLFSHGS